MPNSAIQSGMRFTTYHPSSKRVAAYNDGMPVEPEAADILELVSLYMHYHLQSGLDAPEFGDGAVKFGKRIRILAGNSDTSKQRLFDICSDGIAVNPTLVNVDPVTGIPK